MEKKKKRKGRKKYNHKRARKSLQRKSYNDGYVLTQELT
jgi:hypothetical protein